MHEPFRCVRVKGNAELDVFILCSVVHALYSHLSFPRLSFIANMDLSAMLNDDPLKVSAPVEPRPKPVMDPLARERSVNATNYLTGALQGHSFILLASLLPPPRLLLYIFRLLCN